MVCVCVCACVCVCLCVCGWQLFKVSFDTREGTYACQDPRSKVTVVCGNYRQYRQQLRPRYCHLANSTKHTRHLRF